MTTRVSESSQPTERREQLDALRPGRSPDRIEHEIDPTTTRELPDPPGESLTKEHRVAPNCSAYPIFSTDPTNGSRSRS